MSEHSLDLKKIVNGRQLCPKCLGERWVQGCTTRQTCDRCDSEGTIPAPGYPKDMDDAKMLLDAKEASLSQARAEMEAMREQRDRALRANKDAVLAANEKANKYRAEIVELRDALKEAREKLAAHIGDGNEEPTPCDVRLSIWMGRAQEAESKLAEVEKRLEQAWRDVLDGQVLVDHAVSEQHKAEAARDAKENRIRELEFFWGAVKQRQSELEAALNEEKQYHAEDKEIAITAVAQLKDLQEKLALQDKLLAEWEADPSFKALQAKLAAAEQVVEKAAEVRFTWGCFCGQHSEKDHGTAKHTDQCNQLVAALDSAQKGDKRL